MFYIGFELERAKSSGKLMANYRYLNRDGTYNIGNTKKKFNITDLYHSLITMDHLSFIVSLAFGYTVINLIFGSIYFALGPEALEGLRTDTAYHHFLDCFFFSVQTLASSGGRFVAIGYLPHLIGTIESFCGLLTVGFFTGIFFARISKPTNKILFSNIAIISKHNLQRQLFFRIANLRLNQIIEAKVSVTLSIDATSLEGYRHRKLIDLELERNQTPVFGVTWTVRHLICEKSPLFHLTCDDLKKANAEVIVIVTGLDSSFGQTISAHFSYIPDEIVEDAVFVDIIERNTKGQIIIHHDKIHEYKRLT